MTDPQDFENVTYYSDATETNLNSTSPATSIARVAHDSFGRRVSGSSINHQLSALFRSILPSRQTGSADDANPSAEPSLVPGQDDLNPPIVTVHNTDSGGDSTTNAQTYSSSAAASKLILAPFGSETWTTTIPRPYLNFAPRPDYEPTGELLREETESFDRFDSPVENRASTGASSHPFDPASETSLRASSDPKAVNVFVQPSVPRSALKRKAESQESPVTVDLTSNTLKPGGGRPSKARAVSFERMSGLGPATPEQGSTTSGLQAAQGRSDSAAQRRARHSSTSAPRTNVPSTSGSAQNTGPPNRGTRDPSGHPPSILPPEKVFPIQIGSELFRLSGASISSDGKTAPLKMIASFAETNASSAILLHTIFRGPNPAERRIWGCENALH